MRTKITSIWSSFKDKWVKVLMPIAKPFYEEITDFPRGHKTFHDIYSREDDKEYDYSNHIKELSDKEIQEAFPEEVIEYTNAKQKHGHSFIVKEDIQRAKKVGINTLYSFQKIRKNGSKFSASCPFHEDNTPSFIINEDNTFKCFSCGEFGDSIQFIILLEGLNFSDAVRFLND